MMDIKNKEAQDLALFAYSDFRSGRYEAAIAGFRESLAIEESENARVYLVTCLYSLKPSANNNEEIIKEASLAMSMGYKDPEFFYFIGSARNSLAISTNSKQLREEAKPYLEQFIAMAGKDRKYKGLVKTAKRQIKLGF
jgi:tetratricopeptide (TPR) repeat protein